jgi:hypothetical protein
VLDVGDPPLLPLPDNGVDGEPGDEPGLPPPMPPPGADGAPAPPGVDGADTGAGGPPGEDPLRKFC